VRPATHADLHTFCRIDGWVDADAAAGRPRGDHVRYRRVLGNGEVLRTKVSHGSGEVGGALFRHVLRDQLRVTEEAFWRAVRTRRPPVRPEDGAVPEPSRALPLWLVRRLRDQAGVPEAEIATMDPAAARAAWEACAQAP
jgi:hypothetical protein